MNSVFFDKVFSNERMHKYIARYPNDGAKAILHYQCNSEISEAFYPCLSVLEVALRNAIDRELKSKFNAADWYIHFSSTPGLAKLLKEINVAESNITKRRKWVCLDGLNPLTGLPCFATS